MGVIHPFPFDDLPVVPRRELSLLNALCRWLAGLTSSARTWSRVEKLVGCPVAVRDVAIGGFSDAYSGTCALRRGGGSVEVRGSNSLVRQIAQQVLGGPEELPAPRPLGGTEQAMWALFVATALEDLGIPGEVWACEVRPVVDDACELVAVVEIAGRCTTAGIRAPRSLALRVPPPRDWRWPDATIVDAAVICGRCAIPAEAVGKLAVRSLVTLEPGLGGAPLSAPGRVGAELVVFGGAVGISGQAGTLVAEVATGYVPRAMTLPDDAHVEFTVGLGTTQLSLRQVFELSVGQVVSLGRPLAGPYEIRAAGKRVGYGELVSIDGELGVRIVSLEEQ